MRTDRGQIQAVVYPLRKACRFLWKRKGVLWIVASGVLFLWLCSEWREFARLMAWRSPGT